MAKITRFEDLVAWQKAREVVRETYRMTRDARFREDPDLVSQMRRASVSTMSNIAEGFDRGTRSEFAQFLKIALGSAGELRSQSYVAEDCGFTTAGVAQHFREQDEEVCRLVNGLRQSVLRRRDESGN